MYSVPRDVYTLTETPSMLIPNTHGDVDFWYIFVFKTHYPRLYEPYVTYTLNIRSLQAQTEISQVFELQFQY